MKYVGLMVALATVAMAPVWAEDLINKKEFQTATQKAGDMAFNTSLAQTARLLDYCGKKPQAQEVRDYLQPVTMVMAKEMFKDVQGTEASLQSMRGMYLSRAIAASMATEIATIGLLEQMGGVDAAQKKKLCDFADSGYAKVVEVKAKGKAANEGASAKTVPAAPAATPMAAPVKGGL